MKRTVNHRLLLTVVSISFCLSLPAQSKSGEEVAIENYYKVKWGQADEFISLWKKNHYPLLKKAQESGEVISIVAVKPSLHAGEDTRWDFKVVITFKNLNAAFDPNLTARFKKTLYPDTDKLVKEEALRFSLLLAHWDVLVEQVSL